MTPEMQACSPGEWIVHRNHGVGQIKGTEDLHVAGQKNTYCKIRTRDSTIWMPLEKLNAEWIRPLASPAEIEQALEALRRPPGLMETDPTKRKNQISKVKPNNSPVVIAETLRDLSAHNKEKAQVSQTDVDALRRFMDMFLSEWSACMNLEIGVLKQQLNDLLARP